MSRGLALKDLPPGLREVVRRHRKPVPYQEEVSAGRILDVPHVEPVAAPRMTRADRRPPVRPCVAKYREYGTALRNHALLQDFKLSDSGYSFKFIFPLGKAQLEQGLKPGDPHQKKPDLDNLLKAVFDQLRPDNDNKIWQIAGAIKIWGEKGGVFIERLT